MTQKARPIDDVSWGGWQTRPLYEKLTEKSPSDQTRVTSLSDPVGDAFEVKLATLVWPRSGAQKLTVRLRKTAGGYAPAIVRLLQGAKLITYQYLEPGTSFAEEALKLTDSERQAITDYSDLRVRVTAGLETVSGCSACPVSPKYWGLKIADVTNGSCSDCAKVNGLYTLTYQSGCIWRSASVLSTCPGTPLPWTLAVSGSFWELTWGLLVKYRLSSASWNCLGRNTLSLFSSTGACKTWPATVNLDPV